MLTKKRAARVRRKDEGANRKLSDLPFGKDVQAGFEGKKADLELLGREGREEERCAEQTRELLC